MLNIHLLSKIFKASSKLLFHCWLNKECENISKLIKSKEFVTLW